MRISTLLCAVLISVFSLTVGAQEIVIKFSHVVADATPKGKGALKFKELAEKYTDGRVKVKVYADSTLYKDKEEMEALLLGAVQMIAPSLAKFGQLGVKTFEVFDLPYLFDNFADLHKVTTGPLGAKFLASLEPKGINYRCRRIFMGFWWGKYKYAPRTFIYLLYRWHLSSNAYCNRYSLNDR